MHRKSEELSSTNFPALIRAGTHDQLIVRLLVQALKDEDAFLRGIAAEILGEMGPDARESVPALIETLKDGDTLVRVAAIRALAQTGEQVKATQVALIKLLDDKDDLIRGLAVDYLSLTVPASKGIVQALVRTALTDSDPVIRANAAAALYQDGGL